jgi:Fe(3+) dicitrate transport protein
MGSSEQSGLDFENSYYLHYPLRRGGGLSRPPRTWRKMAIRTASLLIFAGSLTPAIPSALYAEEPAQSEESRGALVPGGTGKAPAGPTEAPAQPERPINIPLTEIIGTAPDALEHIPGSGHVVTQESIFNNHRLTINEALRPIPGVVVRDEEGLGIRPNIAIRGLDPTRSRKVHIMEDGVPIMLMPYGDPSSYYFPPIFRFDRIELLKGSGQLLYGPSNVGGVLNLITRMPPATPGGFFQFFGGNLNFYNTHFNYGGTWGKSGYMVDYFHYQSDTPRFTNIRAKVDDLTFKTVQELSERTQILAKFNYYREDSGIGYQGLTESEYSTNPRTTPFTNDNFDFRRIGFHVAVNHMFTANLTSTTNFFGHYIQRDWSRQSTDLDGDPTTANATFNTGNAIAATATRALPTAGRFINAREYWVYGVEPRFNYVHRLFGIDAVADFGVRYMYEESNRQQFRNLVSGIGQSCFGGANAQSCLGEDNLRKTNAYAAFLQERLTFGKFTVTPGVRLEYFKYSQQNRQAPGTSGTGAFNDIEFIQPLPGIGATYSPNKDYTFFAGVHRGFAPPQISDAIQLNNAVVDLEAELAWIYEVGVRSTPLYWLGAQATLFRMDFDNQIISQSAAGGTGATLTNAGETRHQGIEFAGKADLLDLMKGVADPRQDFFVDLSYTWLAEAEFTGTRNSSLSAISLLPGEASTVSISGNRLTYAPKHMLTAGIGYANADWGFNTRLETQCISDMFSDDRNTVNPTPNGQRGVIKGWCVLNAAANQYVKSINTTFFVTGKNLLDQTFIVDRSRGIYAGLPLMVQAGARWNF